MCSAIQQEDRFADSRESRFQAAKRSNMSSAILLQDFRNRVFGVRNVQIGAEASCKMFGLLMYKNPVFSVRNVQVWIVLSSNLLIW